MEVEIFHSVLRGVWKLDLGYMQKVHASRALLGSL